MKIIGIFLVMDIRFGKLLILTYIHVCEVVNEEKYDLNFS